VRRALTLLAVAAGAFLGIQTAAPGGQGITAPFVGNFENLSGPGWEQFTGLQYEQDRPLQDSFSLVDRPVRSGRRAARITARHGYSRFGHNEDTSLVHLSYEGPGEDYWYAFSTYFPPDWVAPHAWGIFAQWHANLGTSPIIGFNARNDDAFLNVHTGLTDEARNSFQYDLNRPLLKSLSKGRWNDFVMHVRWSESGGIIEVWHKLAGQQVLKRLILLDGIPTLQWTSARKGFRVYLLFGLYRGSYCATPTQLDCSSSRGVQAPNTLYLDAYARAATFEDVVRAAFPGERVLRCQPRACRRVRMLEELRRSPSP
jgi:hypothetical protein